MDHGAVGVEGVAEGRLGREPVEEREERMWGERVGVEVDEVDYVIGCEGGKEFSERVVAGLSFGVENGLRDC